ncbi:MAG: amino acid ABC transporter permease [Roseovarius sp.]|nr:amino acid ABC transporter permease [Roseovarius sp.]MCY4207833.1 amino acid ABC transporter permease [Roseovarius sp.]MCY4292788.1 amino acid ABC transporter permease [Roseovarius sp.]MCY4316707.1 amino acid ABC transporter permease [Roseovarius sp.]
MGYDWDFSYVFKNQGILWEGFVGTIQIATASLFLGLVVGLFLASLRMSKYRLLSIPATCLIEFLRMTPLMVQIFWVFFALPILIDVRLDPFAAGLIAFSMQSGSFFAEVFRGGIQSIDRSQWEGAKSLGMTNLKMMRRIILPQAVRRMIPPLMERSFELIKGTTQMAAISYSDLLYNAMVLSSQLYRPVEIMTFTALFYLCFLTLISFGMRTIETRIEKARE